MKTHLYVLLLISLPTIGILMSCDKHHAKKLAGTYSCKVTYSYFNITPTNIDSIYYEDIEIKQEGKFVSVLGTSIHIDSLWKEKKHAEGYIHSYLTVLFKNDSVYITTSSGGHGGNSSRTYEGKKK